MGSSLSSIGHTVGRTIRGSKKLTVYVDVFDDKEGAYKTQHVSVSIDPIEHVFSKAAIFNSVAHHFKMGDRGITISEWDKRTSKRVPWTMDTAPLKIFPKSVFVDLSRRLIVGFDNNRPKGVYGFGEDRLIDVLPHLFHGKGLTRIALEILS